MCQEYQLMIPIAHEKFRRWAVWVLAPIPYSNLGYGSNILARIREGKGRILPGAPKGSGPKTIERDQVAMEVDIFLRTCTKDEKRLIKTFYLSQGHTVEDRAKFLKIPVRTMYSRIERIQIKFINSLERSNACGLK